MVKIPEKSSLVGKILKDINKEISPAKFQTFSEELEDAVLSAGIVTNLFGTPIEIQKCVKQYDLIIVH